LLSVIRYLKANDLLCYSDSQNNVPFKPPDKFFAKLFNMLTKTFIYILSLKNIIQPYAL